MVIYLDDLFWLIFGFLCIIIGEDSYKRLRVILDLLFNCIILCIGLMGVSLVNNMVEIVKMYVGIVLFLYICNVKIFENGDFIEIFYLMKDGLINI